MVLVEVDGNYIEAEPMKNKSEGSMIKTYLALWNRLTASGTVKPKTHIREEKNLIVCLFVSLCVCLCK
jgi:hypothetical protein